MEHKQIEKCNKQKMCVETMINTPLKKIIAQLMQLKIKINRLIAQF